LKLKVTQRYYKSLRCHETCAKAGAVKVSKFQELQTLEYPLLLKISNEIQFPNITDLEKIDEKIKAFHNFSFLTGIFPKWNI